MGLAVIVMVWTVMTVMVLCVVGDGMTGVQDASDNSYTVSRVGAGVALVQARSSRRGASTKVFKTIHGSGTRQENEDEEAGTNGASEVTESENNIKLSGLHMMVLHQRSARVVVKRVFRTDEMYTWWADVVWWVTRVSAGRVVVVAAGGDASGGLRQARTLFTHLGAVFISYLSYGTVWCWAFIKGGITLYEAVIRGPYFTQFTGDPRPEHSNSNVYCEGVVHLLNSTAPKQNTHQERARWQYCASHGAMGGLCDEVAPDPVPLATPPPVALAAVPVVITAGNRHQYLYHTLTTLLTTPGANRHNFHVVLGDAPPSTTHLLRLLHLNFTTLPVHGHHNHKLFRYYRQVFSFIATTFPSAPAAILLDEDVEVSPDFFSYFNQTLWLLHKDPTLYCINAHSLLPNMKRGRGAHYVQRGAAQMFWGYAVSLSFVHEALSVWPDNTKHLDIHTYDFWLYDRVRGGRECVYPEVSRIRHYGVGVNTNPSMHEYEAWHRPLLDDSNVPLLNTALMLHDAYEADFVQGLTEARVIDAEKVCDPNISTIAKKPGQPVVVYYRQEVQNDVLTWYLVGQCAQLHPWSEQGQHAGAHLSYLPLSPSSPPLTLSSHPLNKYGFNYVRSTSRMSSNTRFPQVYHRYTSEKSNDNEFPPVYHRSTSQKSSGTEFHQVHPRPTSKRSKDMEIQQGYKGPRSEKGSDIEFPQEYHQSTSRKGSEMEFQRVYYVGVPYSRYSHLRPANAPVFDVDNTSDAHLNNIQSRFTDSLSMLLINSTHYTYHALIQEFFVN